MVEYRDPHRPYHYKVQIHKYDFGNATAQRHVQKGIFSFPRAESRISLYTSAAIEAFDYAFLVIDLWNEHSKELNGWKPISLIRFWTSKARSALQRLWKKESIIHFQNGNEINHLLKLWPPSKAINRYLFALLSLCGEINPASATENLNVCIEILIKNQIVWHITTYKSLNGREFTFPWEYECPLEKYKTTTKEDKLKKQQEANKRERMKMQTGIMKYFMPSKSQQIAIELDQLEKENKEDLSQEILDIIRDLEEASDDENDSDIEILEKYYKPERDLTEIANKAGTWNCPNCEQYNVKSAIHCCKCGYYDCPPTFGKRRKQCGLNLFK